MALMGCGRLAACKILAGKQAMERPMRVNPGDLLAHVGHRPTSAEIRVVSPNASSRRHRRGGVRGTAPALDRKAPRTTPVRRQLFSVCRATDCGVGKTRRHFGTVVAAAARVRPRVIELVPR